MKHPASQPKLSSSTRRAMLTFRCILPLAVVLVASVAVQRAQFQEPVVAPEKEIAKEKFVPSTADIPELAWEKRSDWINVKTDVVPGAKGDGIADDTAAIQSALNKMENGAIMGPTIYFPPGTYKINKTLEPPATPKFGPFLGFTLIGHGRTSTLVWDGEVGGRMFWTKHGIPQARYVGLSWDGKGKAAVGFEHSVTVPDTNGTVGMLLSA